MTVPDFFIMVSIVERKYEMNRTIVAIAVCVFFILVSLAAAWPQANPQKRVSISFDRADPLDVFTVLAKSLDCKVSLDEKVNQTIGVRSHVVSLQTALDAICESIGCRWRIEDGKLTVQPLAQAEASALTSRSTLLKEGLEKRLRSNMYFESVPLPVVLEDIFNYAGVGYSLFGETLSESKLVTIDVSNQRVADAVMQVLNNAGMAGSKIMQTLDEAPSSYFVSALSAATQK